MIHMEEILIVNLAGVLILVLSQFSRISSFQEKRLSDWLFDAMIGLTLGALVAETMSFALDGRPGTLVHVLQYVLNGYLFLASCGVGTLWVLFVDHRIYHNMKRTRKLLLPVTLPFAVIAVLILCDLFGTGIIFSVTEANVYLRGRLVMLPYLVLGCDYSASIALAVLAVKRNRYAQFFPVLYFVIPCVVGTLIQGLCYGLSVGWFCVSLTFLFVQLQLNKQNAFVDDLSGLYNRKYYYHVISRMAGAKRNEMISGVMMDVNGFKGINDQFGHTTGDDAIRNLGELISEVITEQDIAFRHSGDEFIIISTLDSEGEVEQLVDTLTQKVTAFNGTSGKPYQLSLAIGYTLCKTAELDSDKFLHEMDSKMYEAKAAYYSREENCRRKYIK